MSRARGTVDEAKIRALSNRIRYLERENNRLRKRVTRAEENKAEDEPTVESYQPPVEVRPFTCGNSDCQSNAYTELKLSIRGIETLYLLCKDCKKAHKVKK